MHSSPSFLYLSRLHPHPQSCLNLNSLMLASSIPQALLWLLASLILWGPPSLSASPPDLLTHPSGPFPWLASLIHLLLHLLSPKPPQSIQDDLLKEDLISCHIHAQIPPPMIFPIFWDDTQFSYPQFIKPSIVLSPASLLPFLLIALSMGASFRFFKCSQLTCLGLCLSCPTAWDGLTLLSHGHVFNWSHFFWGHALSLHWILILSWQRNSLLPLFHVFFMYLFCLPQWMINSMRKGSLSILLITEFPAPIQEIFFEKIFPSSILRIPDFSGPLGPAVLLSLCHPWG